MLGGLVPPLAYREGRGSDLSNLCIVPRRVEGGKCTTKDGDNFFCAHGWRPVQQ